LPQLTEIATVIVCDPDERALATIADNLASDYFDVLPASIGEEALRFCQYNSPDLLILSLALPDAFELIRKIREANPHAALTIELAGSPLNGGSRPEDHCCIY
jgi:DNA-binding response OmpR family regulator